MNKIVNKVAAVASTAALLAGTLIPFVRPMPAAAATTWNVGDVFAGVAGGSYKVYDNAGVFKETISDGLGGFTTGCAFNGALDKLYTTNFSNTKVKVYDNASPHPIVQTIDTAVNSPGGHSESIVFAANGDFYVGHPDGNDDIHRYNSAGVFQQAYDVPIESRGSDWMDLAADQMTMFYTSEGGLIKRYDVSGAGAPLANFAAIGGVSYALRLLPPGDGSGGLLVANTTNIKRLDGASAVVQTYDAPGENSWFSLNLDPNGTSFWAGDFGTNNFYRFNITTGVIEVGPIASGGSLFGLCLKAEPTAALPKITLDPPTDTNEVGGNHTVTATIKAGGQAVSGVLVSFSVTAGPNTGQVSDPNTGECAVNNDCTTNGNGQVSWTYTSNGTVGTDVIQACFTDKSGTQQCVRATKEWVDTTPPKAACIESVNPHGAKVPPAGSTTLPGSRGGQNEDGFYHLGAEDNSGLPVAIFIRGTSGLPVPPFGPFASSTTVKITEAPGAIPTSKPMGSTSGAAGAVTAHITLDSDAVMRAVDAAGNVTEVTCLVPPPPK